jgi:glucose-1-phosphate thymidylyltransferase
MTKGIILAGGSGTRLFPMTRATSKQMQPVYDKPMVYYPLATLLSMGIKDILLISTPRDIPRFQELFKDIAMLGIDMRYAVQPHPGGIAQAITIGESFLDGDQCCLVLGDNIFIGDNRVFADALEQNEGATIFGYEVKDPAAYGVAEMRDGKVLSIEEKPLHPKSKLAVPGIYLYDATAPMRAKSLTPSARGEIEITELNAAYLCDGLLRGVPLPRGFAWLDAGTPGDLAKATSYIAAIEERSGVKVGCIEEEAFKAGFVTAQDLRRYIETLPKCEYRQYLLGLLTGQ